MQDIVRLSAVELLGLYRRRELSPVEATQAVLAQIEAQNEATNAYCLIRADEALAAARASERRWQAGEQAGLLDGVPTSVKDLLLTSGWPTLRGSRTIDQAGPWPVDAPAVAHLRAHGAVLLGKTATPEWGWKGVTDSPLTGVTRNPWDLTRTPGGSSGGSAAAVASGLGPLSVGTDGGGSIRIPASFCGIVGLKPTHGRVPVYPPSTFGTLSHVGPMARTVADTALMLDTLGSPDPRDPLALDRQAPVAADCDPSRVRGLRVAYSPALGYAQVDPDVAGAVRSTATPWSSRPAQRSRPRCPGATAGPADRMGCLRPGISRSAVILSMSLRPPLCGQSCAMVPRPGWGEDASDHHHRLTPPGPTRRGRARLASGIQVRAFVRSQFSLRYPIARLRMRTVMRYTGDKREGVKCGQTWGPCPCQVGGLCRV